MKIDGSHVADDLLQRMQEAHEQQKTEQVSRPDTAKTFSIDELQGSRAAEAVTATEPTALESRMRTTAEKALRGEFTDAAAVRKAVVEDILREKWEPKLGPAKAAKMLRTLTPTLVDDPEFTRQVDEMLILASPKRRIEMKSERLANGFLVTSCPSCVREVLVVRDLDPDGELIAACLHCDTVLEEGSLRAVDAEILSELGYDVPGAPSPQGSRGCRDGKCGVQQPDA